MFCLFPFSNIKKEYFPFYTNDFKGNNLQKQTIFIKTII